MNFAKAGLSALVLSVALVGMVSPSYAERGRRYGSHHGRHHRQWVQPAPHVVYVPVVYAPQPVRHFDTRQHIHLRRHYHDREFDSAFFDLRQDGSRFRVAFGN